TPSDGAASVATGSAVTASFKTAMDQATLDASSFSLTDAAGNVVVASVSYDAATKTAILQPAAPLTTGTSYSASLRSAKDLSGRSLPYVYTWTFRTTGCPCTLFSDLAQPANQTAAGTYELGVRLKVDQPLTIRAIRFYKGVGESGAHTGTVWTSNGVALAHVAFTGESASGWQQQALVAPLQLQANTTYVVSVNTN